LEVADIFRRHGEAYRAGLTRVISGASNVA
jgi:hypothetical protein